MIHYHGSPFSGGEFSHMALQARHACVSYAAPSCITTVAELCQSFILDNGAFSAWSSGKSLDIEGFRAWANFWRLHPACDWYLIPDVIDGSEEENDALLDGWPGGVPVWHLHESFGRLEKLVHSFPRVAFGSSGQYATIGNSSWWARISEAMDIACNADGHPYAKLHGLRMLDPTIFSHLPFSSADSTNVARNIGIDKAWEKAPYAPKSKYTRALIMMERIEAHCSAATWVNSKGVLKNFELFG